MAVREVAPLDQKQWDRLQYLMARGPTEKQLKLLAESKERVKNIKVEF